MGLAKTTIGRALRSLKNLQQYLASKVRKPIVSETSVDGKGAELQTQYTAYDLAAADGTLRTSAGRFEQVAQYCLARDFRNMQRSRRYIYARAHQERVRASLSALMEFAVQNPDLDLEKIMAMNPDQISASDLKTLRDNFAL